LLDTPFSDAALGMTVVRLIDFWYVIEKLGKAAAALLSADQRTQRLAQWKLRLLNTERAAHQILGELKDSGPEWKTVGEGPLIVAMWKDARTHSPYLCTDATGVLVQHAEKCRRGHFFVVVAPEKHVLFNYSARHDMEAVDELLAGFTGKLVADALVVYHHLYETGVVECGCWAHARRYFFKALASDAARANHALDIIRKLFSLERQWATAPPVDRLSRRKSEAKPLVDDFFAWCDDEALKVLDETPISKAIQYARNQRKALEQFLTDGRLPIDNNISERALRREAVGRKNWLFVGSDDGGSVNATFVSLLASCQMHGIEPYAYLRDLFCLLPSWPQTSVLELAPTSWRKTSARPEVVALLDANLHRQVTLGIRVPESEVPKVS
jgi:transposase